MFWASKVAASFLLTISSNLGCRQFPGDGVDTLAVESCCCGVDGVVCKLILLCEVLLHIEIIIAALALQGGQCLPSLEKLPVMFRSLKTG